MITAKQSTHESDHQQHPKSESETGILQNHVACVRVGMSRMFVRMCENNDSTAKGYLHDR
jgi:hypothetical protein